MTTKSSRILICDDETSLADELAEYFLLCGWHAVPVYHCDAARKALLSSETFDCLLTDNAMPGESGSALVALAQALPASQRPKVICIMTGATGNDSIATSDVLQVGKPFDPDALLKQFNIMLGTGI